MTQCSFSDHVVCLLESRVFLTEYLTISHNPILCKGKTERKKKKVQAEGWPPEAREPH